VNGYQDSDGCPDTPPTVVDPPSTLPSSVALTMPAVGYQGSEGSCVAFAVAYARSSDQYYRSGASSYNEATNITSPEFLFNQTKTDDNCSGSAMLNALEFLKVSGICTWQTMPYSASNGCSLMPTSQQSTEALNYKIASYSKVYTSDMTAIKTLLASHRALLTTFSIDDNFKYAQPGYIWKSYAGTPSLVHGVTICGYDDSKNAFKIINSWGTSWGDQGYLWIDYDFFKNSLSNFVFVMNY
jgi:C1A family cysteine protease